MSALILRPQIQGQKVQPGIKTGCQDINLNKTTFLHFKVFTFCMSTVVQNRIRIYFCYKMSFSDSMMAWIGFS